jgi:hypothetical protein
MSTPVGCETIVAWILAQAGTLCRARVCYICSLCMNSITSPFGPVTNAIRTSTDGSSLGRTTRGSIRDCAPAAMARAWDASVSATFRQKCGNAPSVRSSFWLAPPPLGLDGAVRAEQFHESPVPCVEQRRAVDAPHDLCAPGSRTGDVPGARVPRYKTGSTRRNPTRGWRRGGSRVLFRGCSFGAPALLPLRASGWRSRPSSRPTVRGSNSMTGECQQPPRKTLAAAWFILRASLSFA